MQYGGENTVLVTTIFVFGKFPVDKYTEVGGPLRYGRNGDCIITHEIKKLIHNIENLHSGNFF